jgi:hypothetical protein
MGDMAGKKEQRVRLASPKAGLKKQNNALREERLYEESAARG